MIYPDGNVDSRLYRHFCLLLAMIVTHSDMCGSCIPNHFLQTKKKKALVASKARTFDLADLALPGHPGAPGRDSRRSPDAPRASWARFPARFWVSRGGGVSGLDPPGRDFRFAEPPVPVVDIITWPKRLVVGR